MNLNLGAGDTRYTNFVNCDHDAGCNPDYVFDLERDKWPFESNSVDNVVAHHVLEHMGEGYFHFMKELYRVCKHESIIDIKVPHHRHDYFADDPTHRRAITPAGLTLFSKKYNQLCIEQKASASRLGLFYDVDFEVVDVLNVPGKKYITMFEGKQVEFVEQYMDERCNIIEEVQIKITAIKNYD